MKKKLIALTLAVALILVAGIGMTLAYFTDTETATNVFTMGNVSIALRESDDTLTQPNDKYQEELGEILVEPSVKIPKNVWVENDGKNPAYVRVGIIIPAELEPMLTLEYAAFKDTNNNDIWALSKDSDGNVNSPFEFKHDGIEYVGYSYTYLGTETDKLAPAGKTALLLKSVTLKEEVTCEVVDNSTVYTYYNEGTKYTFADEDGKIDVLVYAEAGQTNGSWNSADEALNKMFKDPGEAAEYYFVENVAFAATADELVEALESGKDVVLNDDVKIEPAGMSNAYGTTGINVKNGQTIDGNGNTLDIKGAGGTWDSGINTTGGLIKDLTVTGSFRGIFINHNSSHSEPVVLDNVTIDGTTYTISCDQGLNQNFEATDSTFNGWTSYAATLGSAKFVDCKFGEGNGYSYCRPYAPTEFIGCEFEAGYTVEPRAAVTFEKCTLNGVALTAANIDELVTSTANVTIK